MIQVSRIWMFVFCALLLLISCVKVRTTEASSRDINMIYAVYSPGYLGFLEGPDYDLWTIHYLMTLWNQIKDDPNPALELVLNEDRALASDPGGGKGITSEMIVKIAQGCEEYGIQFYLFIAGPFSAPIVTLSTAEEVLKVAPSTCKGFYISETLNSGQGWNYWSELISFRNLCKEYGRKLVWSEHSRDGSRGMGWWGYALCNKEEWESMFSLDYADVIVPLHETNDPRVTMVNMGTCLGMWLGGLAEEWGFSSQDWWWNDAGYGPIETCPPELIYRMCLEAASLGSVYYQFEHMQMIWEWGSWSLAPIYKEGIRPFIELYKDGKIVIPDKQDILSLCPVALRLTEASRFSDFSILDSRPILENTPETYIPNYLYHEKQYVDGLIPETPFGILVCFPGNADMGSLPDFNKVLDSDGSGIFYEDEYLSPSETKQALLTLVKEGKATMPLQVEGAYGVVTQLEQGRYLLWLLNSKEKYTKDMYANVRLSFPEGSLFSFHDRITGEMIGSTTQGEMSITIENWRILEVSVVE